MKKMAQKENLEQGTLILNLHDIGCKNCCIFCGKHSRYINRKKSDLIANQELEKLKLIKKLKIGSIIISGNDPIEYAGFIDFLRKIKKATDLNIFLQSHCINFENLDYLKKVIAVGNINKIQIPIYGHNAKIHDSVTKNPGSFDSIIKAVDNFKKIGFDEIQINTLFLKQNQNHLQPFFDFLMDLGYPIDVSLPCIPSCKGKYYSEKKKYISDLNKVKIFFEKLKKEKNNISLIQLHDIPFCLAPGISNFGFRSELSHKGYEHFRNKQIDTVVVKGELLAAYRILAKDEECRSCVFDNKCQGITKPYIDLKLFKAKPLRTK